MSVNSKMKAIADAIRAKTGGTAALTLDGMAEAVAGIEAGGGGGGFPNGTEWTQGNVTESCTGLAYANGLWVAGKYYSTDGMTWMAHSGIASYYIAEFLCYVNGEWLCNASGQLYRSSDGATWTEDKYTGRGTAYANGLWVSGIWYSTDGKTWTKGNIATQDYRMKSVCNIYGKWFACSLDGLFYSTDGMTWTKSNITGGVVCVYYANGMFVAGGSGNGLWYSTDGMTWTQSNITDRGASSIHNANGLWVAGSYQAGASGSGNGIYYSTDGMTWTQVIAKYLDGNRYRDAGGFGNLAYSNGLWVAGESWQNGLYYSIDGMTWTQSNVTGCICYGLRVENSVVVAATNNGIYYSPTWLPSN